MIEDNTKYNIIGQNLRCLRKMYHESQSDLSNATGLQKTKISNWENGREEPGKESIRIICEHYRISIHELQYEIIKNTTLPEKMQIIDAAKELLKDLPITADKKSLKHDNFKKGYSFYKSALKNKQNDIVKFICQWYNAFNYFDISYKQDSCIEGLKNAISLSCLFSSSNEFISDKLDELIELIFRSSTQTISSKLFLKKVGGKNKSKYLKKEFIQKFDDYFFDGVEILSKKKVYLEDVYYLFLLRYVGGKSITELEYYDALKMASEFLAMLILTNNKFAKKYYKLLENNVSNNETKE